MPASGLEGCEVDSTVDEPEDALASAGVAGAVGAADAPACKGPSCRPCGGGSSGQANIMAVLTAEASSGRACAEFAAACASEALALPPVAACNMQQHACLSNARQALAAPYSVCTELNMLEITAQPHQLGLLLFKSAEAGTPFGDTAGAQAILLRMACDLG